VLTCGEDAVLSHFAACWLWGLIPEAPRRIDVTVPRGGHRRKSIHVHHAPSLTPTERAEREGIPVTALSRTLLDLAEVASAKLQRAVERAEQLEIFDLTAVDALLERCRGHRGAATLRRAIEEYREPAFTRSELERKFLELVERSGLPQPSVNAFVCGYEIDMYWQRERFAVELDGYRHHRGRAAFERDRLRQEDLKLAGIEMVRISGGRLDREPATVIERLERLLAQRRRQLVRTVP
jgi:very-short-patch-repair endonuclease